MLSFSSVPILESEIVSATAGTFGKKCQSLAVYHSIFKQTWPAKSNRVDQQPRFIGLIKNGQSLSHLWPHGSMHPAVWKVTLVHKCSLMRTLGQVALTGAWKPFSKRALLAKRVETIIAKLPVL